MSDLGKPAHSEMHKDGVRFNIYSNGEIWAHTKDLPAELAATFTSEGKPWIPSHRNFNNTCKQLIRDGDLDGLIMRQKKISKERGMKRNAGVELYAALEQAVTSMQDHGWPNSHLAVKEARRALAKARGEPE